jgi:hypothetical protein
MPNVSKATVEGVATMTQGVGTTPARKFVKRLPMDGSWSIKGTVMAVNPSAQRGAGQEVVFNIAASGVSIAGQITETDGNTPGGVAGTQPASSNPFAGTGVTFAWNNGTPANGNNAAIPPSFEVLLAAPTASGVQALYGAELEVTSLTP